MIPELGLICLIIAFGFACLTTLAQLLPVAQVRAVAPRVWIKAQTLFIVLSYLALTISFYNSDMTVRYVAENSSKLLPWYYRLTAVWGAHEGSILLWVLILSGWILAFDCFERHWLQAEKSMILSVLSFVQAGFLAFIVMTSNPFQRYFESRLADGQDLNPLLQDPGFLIHPPILYMGYVGFAIAFAVSVVGLCLKRYDAAWAKALRKWTLLAWLFLTIGIVLGSWWAYRELGWGGFWFWDPVENASFMPWLSGTALVHSLIVSEKRQQFYGWSILLALLTFSLSLLGTFLVRSGVLVSVHAFASDPTRGAYILVFLSIVAVGSLLLFARNSDSLLTESRFALVSKEALLLVNNLVLFVLMSTVLIGTLYPLLMQALNIAKLSVGAPYFNAIFAPISLVTVCVMTVSGFVYWQKDSAARLGQALLPAILLTTILCCSLLLFHWRQNLNFYLSIICSSLLIVASVISLIKAKAGFRRRLLPMALAHVGVAITILGIGLNVSLSHSLELEMQPGNQVQIAGYTVKFEKVTEHKSQNYEALQAQFTLLQDKHVKAQLNPELRYYVARRQMMTDADLYITPLRDIYIAVGNATQNGYYAVRIYDKPFIRWIWSGGLLMALAAGLALLNLRRRHANQT